jgi:putative sterol carrier protein
MGLIVSNIEASKHEGYLEGTDQEIALIAVSGAMAIAAEGDVSSGEFVEANTNFYVKGALGTKAAHFNGDVEVEGGLTLTGESADLGIEGNVVIEGSLTVEDAAEFQGVAEMQSSLYVTGGLYVSGNIADQADDHAATKGYVDSVAQFDVVAGENATGDPFTVSGNDTLAISGSDDQIAIVLNEDSIQIKLNDDVTISGELTAATGSFSGDLSAVNATLSGDLSAVDATLSGDLTAVDATLSGELTAATGSFSGDLSAVNATLSGDLTADGGSFSNGLYVTGGLYIDGDIALQTDDHAATKGYVDSVAQSGFNVAAGENATGTTFTVSGNDTLAISGSDDQIAIVLNEDSIQIKLNDDVTLVGDLTAVSGSFSGDMTVGTDGNNALTVNAEASFETHVLIKGDLTVQGTTTTIDSENVLIKDPFIILASDSTQTDTHGGIIILSGASGAAGSDLAFGKVASDTWGVVSLDSNNGEIGTIEGEALVKFRAAEVQIGGGDDFLALSGSDLHIHAEESLLLCAGINESLIVLENDIEWLKFDMQANAILPAADNSMDLGSLSQRFRNVFTGDLHLQNDRGHWTLIEEETFITFRDNKTGRRFKMLMEDITDSGTYGPGNDGKM